jgi:Anti-anti-sigma regulatory factor (antagonist of anti-sigma factor)
MEGRGNSAPGEGVPLPPPTPPDILVWVLDEDEVDLSNSDALFEPLMHAAYAAGGRVLLDTTAVTFMDSSGLDYLLRLQQLCRDVGGLLALVPGPRVDRLIQKARLERFFARAPDQDAARALLSAALEAADSVPHDLPE